MRLGQLQGIGICLDRLQSKSISTVVGVYSSTLKISKSEKQSTNSLRKTVCVSR